MFKKKLRESARKRYVQAVKVNGKVSHRTLGAGVIRGFPDPMSVMLELADGRRVLVSKTSLVPQ